VATGSAVPSAALADVRFACDRARGDRSRDRVLVSAAAKHKSLLYAARALLENQHVGDTKAAVCAVYEKVRRAVSVNTGRSVGDDPTAILAVASNARIALYNGGDYLSKKLLAEPATPPDLAKAVRTLVNAYQEMAITIATTLAASLMANTFALKDNPSILRKASHKFATN